MSHDSVPAILGVIAALYHYPSMAYLTHQSCISRNRFIKTCTSIVRGLDLLKSQLNTRNRNLIREIKPPIALFLTNRKARRHSVNLLKRINFASTSQFSLVLAAGVFFSGMASATS